MTQEGLGSGSRGHLCKAPQEMTAAGVRRGSLHRNPFLKARTPATLWGPRDPEDRAEGVTP